ncbi:MAG: YhdH/YhfP family quinone oxidoreductase, partial [Ignavibacteria bacterium]|nr:YhdH/YhfP family quinone oxidoreductase [Ignavibacteria bacterium]
MKAPRFTALWITEDPGPSYSRKITEKELDILPSSDLLIRVHYSSLNYKDGLSATGNRGVTRVYPHIPGVDAAGVVERSSSDLFQPGDEVIVTGHELGSHAWGGWSEYISVPAAWAVKRPEPLTLRESMILGTAGFTAGLAVSKLLHHGLRPDDRPVLVTGSTGGVGCLSVAILSKLGFTVAAVTGKSEHHPFLRSIGAKSIIGRDEAVETSKKPLLSSRWAGVVDNVGGAILESALRQVVPEGAVTCCGNIGSAELHTSLYPFILRGLALFGI